MKYIINVDDIMRKIFLLSLLLALPEFAAANFLGGAGDAGGTSISPTPRAEQEVAVVLKATGQVQISPATNGVWKNAVRGARLNAGDQIRTGDEALAAIVFTDDKSLLKVRSNSKVVINGKREPASGSRRLLKTVSMEFGELWAKVTKGNSQFRVETPSGVAAVKGTVFYGLLDGNGNFFVICLDGLIELINDLGSVSVNAGETGVVSPRQAPRAWQSKTTDIPNWANDGEGGGEMEIEFQDANGQKKKLKIRY